MLAHLLKRVLFGFLVPAISFAIFFVVMIVYGKITRHDESELHESVGIVSDVRHVKVNEEYSRWEVTLSIEGEEYDFIADGDDKKCDYDYGDAMKVYSLDGKDWTTFKEAALSGTSKIVVDILMLVLLIIPSLWSLLYMIYLRHTGLQEYYSRFE